MKIHTFKSMATQKYTPGPLLEQGWQGHYDPSPPLFFPPNLKKKKSIPSQASHRVQAGVNFHASLSAVFTKLFPTVPSSPAGKGAYKLRKGTQKVKLRYKNKPRGSQRR